MTWRRDFPSFEDERMPGHQEQLVARATAAGIRVLPIICNRQVEVDAGYGNSARDCARQARDMRRRFPGLRRVQIGNEPDLQGPRPAVYARTVRAASRVLGARRVILAGLCRGAAEPEQVRRYADPMFRELRRLGVRYHAAAVHPYASTPRGALRRVAAMRRSQRHVGYRRPLWVTEYGWAVSRNERLKFRVDDEQTQARYMRSFLSGAPALGVSVAMVWGVRAIPPDDPWRRVPTAGPLRWDGSAREAWTVMVRAQRR